MMVACIGVVFEKPAADGAVHRLFNHHTNAAASPWGNLCSQRNMFQNSLPVEVLGC